MTNHYDHLKAAALLWREMWKKSIPTLSGICAGAKRGGRCCMVAEIHNSLLVISPCHESRHLIKWNFIERRK